jgi:hypothetical protein
LVKLVRLGKPMTDAILSVLKYVKETTGDEPTQEEIAIALKSYFIMNEIGNQIKFQRKKQTPPEPAQEASKHPFWTLNLIAGPPKNSLVRGGFFNENIQNAVREAQSFAKKSSGVEPSLADIALSLKSSFILSEIKNQIDWQRNGQKKT